MIKKNNKKVIAIYRGGNPISKVFKGGLMVFPDSVQPDQPYVPKHNFAGKFSDSSTEDSWYFVNGAVREALPVNASTKIFDINSNKFTAAVNFGPAIVNSTTIPSTLEELYAFPGYEDNVISIASMFYDCTALKIVDLSNLERKGITNINYLFSGCTNLETLYIDKFNPNGLTNYSEVFKYCNKLMLIRCTTAFRDWCWENAETINLPSQMKKNALGVWDLVDAPKLQGAFAPKISTFSLNDEQTNDGYQLRFNEENFDIPVDEELAFDYRWNAYENGHLYKMDYMGALAESGTSYITTIDQWFDTSTVTDISFMLYKSPYIQHVDFSTFKTDSLVSMNALFGYCENLETVIFPETFDTSKVKYFSDMFWNCPSITELDLSMFDTTAVETAGYLFDGCTSLETLYLDNFDFSQITSNNLIQHMFRNCDNLNHIRCLTAFRDWCWEKQDIINLPDQLREGGSGTWELTDSNIITGKFLSTSTDADHKININQTSYDLDVDPETKEFKFKWTGGDITSLKKCFYQNAKLEKITYFGLDTSKCTDMSLMFFNCTELNQVVFSEDIDMKNVTTFYRMFYYCSKLYSLDVSMFNAENLLDTSEMFKQCGISIVDLSNCKAPNLESISGMFYYCTRIKEIYLPHFDTSKVKYFSDLLYQTVLLEKIEIPKFSMKSATSWGYMLNYSAFNSNANKALCGNIISNTDFYNFLLDNNISSGSNNVGSTWRLGTSCWQFVDKMYEVDTFVPETLTITAKDVTADKETTEISWRADGTAFNTYYNETVPTTIKGISTSENFGMNETGEDREVELSLTKYGLTATTTITQYGYSEYYTLDLGDYWELVEDESLNPDPDLYDMYQTKEMTAADKIQIMPMVINVYGYDSFSVYGRVCPNNTYYGLFMYDMNNINNWSTGKKTCNTTIDDYTLKTYTDIPAAGDNIIELRFIGLNNSNITTQKGYVLLPKQSQPTEEVS